MTKMHLPAHNALRDTNVLERILELGCPPGKIVLGITTIGTVRVENKTDTWLQGLQYDKVISFL